MDTPEKNKAMQMLQYGVYVLTAEAEQDQAAAAVVSWVTQASFAPPLLVAALRVGSRIHGVVQEAQAYTINILDRQHTSVARTFFDTVWEKGGTLAGQRFRTGATGAPILECATGYIECRLDLCLAKGDHSIFVGEVADAGVTGPIVGRPDEVGLLMRDFGVFYGG